jgi:hypothetical protein
MEAPPASIRQQIEQLCFALSMRVIRMGVCEISYLAESNDRMVCTPSRLLPNVVHPRQFSSLLSTWQAHAAPKFYPAKFSSSSKWQFKPSSIAQERAFHDAVYTYVE